MSKMIKTTKVDGETITYKAKIACPNCLERGYVLVANKVRGLLTKKVHKELCPCIKVLNRWRPPAPAINIPWHKQALAETIRTLRIIWWYLAIRKYWILGRDEWHCYWCHRRVGISIEHKRQEFKDEDGDDCVEEYDIAHVEISNRCKCRPPFRDYTGFKNMIGCLGCKTVAIPSNSMVDSGLRIYCIKCLNNGKAHL